MTVISGLLTVQIDGTSGDGDDLGWVSYPAGTNFEVAANSGFDVKATGDTAYQCEYL